jgi:hypothetical protein
MSTSLTTTAYSNAPRGACNYCRPALVKIHNRRISIADTFSPQLRSPAGQLRSWVFIANRNRRAAPYDLRHMD